MKLIKFLICTFSLLNLVACNQDKSKTDVGFLQNYINLNCEPMQVRYDVRKDWGMDCPNLTSIVGILKFSDKNFKQMVDSLKNGKSYDMSLSKDDNLYKDGILTI